MATVHRGPVDAAVMTARGAGPRPLVEGCWGYRVVRNIGGGELDGPIQAGGGGSNNA